ncbi:MAG: FMN-binding protein [Clostridia bacterium]|nr:FMN-binding protein [Clostridia bacterium]
MKKGYLYTIVFMFIVALVFTTVLASVNAIFKSRILTNEQLIEKKAVLNAMSITYNDNEIDKLFANIEEVKKDNLVYYALTDGSNQIEKYAVYFEGSGLWSTLTGYIGVGGNFKTLLGIDFTSQNETPGLGGRIEEEWFKVQFKGVSISDLPLTYGNGIDAITGATLTSKSVMKIINDTINNQVKELEAMK